MICGEWFQRDSSAKIEGFFSSSDSFYVPTRELEADKMVDALNRLDQTDALAEQILGDRAKLEHHANRGHAQSNSHAHAYPMEAETITSTESKHCHNHEAASDAESDPLDWDPERIDDDGYPLVDENGSTLVPVPREGALEEDEASSLTAWAQGYREVRKTCVIRSRDVVTINPRPAGSRKSCDKLCSRRNQRDETETHAHRSETKRKPRQSERSQHRTCYWSRAEKTHSLLPLQTSWTYGERVSESSTEGHS